MKFSNLLEITGVPEDVTIEQLDVIIATTADGDPYTFLHMDDESYLHFWQSTNIPGVGKGIAGIHTSIGRLVIINAIQSLNLLNKPK